MIVEIEKLKKGDFFRRPSGKKVYIYNGYDRFNKKYEGGHWDDISGASYFKKGYKVEIGFDF
jgi:hypothetical protein